MKKQLHYLLLTALLSLFLAPILNANTPPITGNWEVMPKFTDEFDSGIDSENWDTKDSEWVGRFPSYFERNNVIVEDGKLKLTCRELESYKDGGLRYATAAYKSKNKVKYGYFEAKVNAKGSGYWNSFWLYDATPYQNTEIDVCEVVASEDYWFCTAHRFKDLPDYEGTEGEHTKAQKIFENAPNLLGQYHVYGLDWRRDSIVWYFDGNVIFATLNEHWHQPLYVIFDTEVNPSWPALPGSTEEVYEIEYIRSWKNRKPNEIISVGAPSTVVLGETITFPVEYIADATKTISFAFKQRVSPWETYETTTATVNAGRGTVDLSITIPNNLELTNDYKYQVTIGDGTWDGKDDYFDEERIKVSDGSIETKITSVGAPASVMQGETITFPVEYVASTERTISCTFQGTIDPIESYVTATAVVSAGSGTANLTMTIPSDVAIGIDNQFQTTIGDGTWDGQDDNFVVKPVKVGTDITEDKIVSVDAPTSVTQGETITILVDYKATDNRTISTSFQQSVDPWDTYETATTTVGAGSGTASLTMVIPSDLAPGSDYKYQTMIGDGSWDGKKDNLETSPVTVNGGTVSSEDIIISVDAPISVAQGETIAISVDYEASAGRTITIYFKQLLAPWDILETVETVVSAGTGTANLSMTIPDEVALGSDYKYQVLIGDGTYEGKTDLLEKNPITVTEGAGGSVEYQYLKYTVTGSDNFKLLELDWLDGSESYPTSNLTSNTSQSGVTVSGSFGSYCYRAFDGDITETNGLWVGTDVPKYITLDFGSSNVSPTAIRIQKKSWNYLTGFKCEASNDGTSWDLLLDKSLSTTSDLTWTDRTYDLLNTKSSDIALTNNDNLLVSNEMYIFPNPSDGQFHLSLSSKYKGDIFIQILSLDGRIVKTENLSKQNIDFLHVFDITNQIPGTYLIKIIADDYQLQQLIIKQ